jgi:hypothetical protein
MYRKINKGRSITKILIYTVILTWFVVILVENWRDMRISWFREVWDFIDFKAIWENMDSYLSICVIFGAGIFTLYYVVSMFARGRYEGDRSSDSSAEYLAKRQTEWEDDLINNPAYHDYPGNIWHGKMKRKGEDEEP